MGSKFRKDNRSDGGRGFGGNKFGGRDSGKSFGGGDKDRQMHSAVCGECGNKCEVPFRPTGDKPVYCSNCFQGKRGDDSRRPSEPRRERQSFGDNRSDRQMYSAKCSGCGEMCEVPFRPTGDKPVYCNQCFDKNKSGNGSTQGNRGGGDGQLKVQIDALNAKMDKILKILEGGIQENNKPSFSAKASNDKKASVGAQDLAPEKKVEAKKDAEIVREIKEELKQAAKKEKVAKVVVKKTPTKKVAVKKKK